MLQSIMCALRIAEPLVIGVEIRVSIGDLIVRKLIENRYVVRKYLRRPLRSKESLGNAALSSVVPQRSANGGLVLL